MPTIPTLRTVTALTDKVEADDHNDVKTAITTINNFIDTSVPVLGSSNTFTGTITASGFIGAGTGITSLTSSVITASLGFTPAAATSVASVVQTTSTYTVTSTDVIVFCNGCHTVTLPSGSLGRRVVVKDIAGNASSSNITIVGTIDGATNLVISTDYGKAELVHNGTNWSTI